MISFYIKYKIKYELHKDTSNFCVKKHKFRMTWLEKYMYCLFEHRLFDILIGR